MRKVANVSPSPIRKISRRAFAYYLQSAKKYSIGGITCYVRPAGEGEWGFLIRRKAGRAVQRNRTRRLFWGLIRNQGLQPPPGKGLLFLFHRTFLRTRDLEPVLAELLAWAQKQ